MTPAVKEYLQAWLMKADHDIISAQRLLEIEPMILDKACFHCQQAVEKSLKAFLIYNSQEVERTHNIRSLLTECAQFDAVFNTIDPLNINAFAVQARYPDTSLMPEKEEAVALYRLAIEVNNLVKERIVFND